VHAPPAGIVLAVNNRSGPSRTTKETAVHLRSITKAGIAGGVAAAAVLASTSPAWAATGTTPGTEHFVHTETSAYPGPGDDPNSFYGIFSLDGACGFASARFAQSDTENFYIVQHDDGAAAGDWQARAIIADEPWSFVAEDADHYPVATFNGTADEFVTARGDDSPQGYHSINYRFDGTAVDAAGESLHLIVQGRLRSDQADQITRFDYHVQSCTLH
jgi:hypothetical protein